MFRVGRVGERSWLRQETHPVLDAAPPSPQAAREITCVLPQRDQSPVSSSAKAGGMKLASRGEESRLLLLQFG